MPVGWVALLALATLVDGLLAGASLDQSIKQLPARHRIGVLAYSAYSQAADLRGGVAWYAALGIGGALLTTGAAAIALLLGVAAQQQLAVLIAGVLSMAHSAVTARAAPMNFRQRAASSDEAALRAIFDRFERWQALRAGLQLATFGAMLWALAASATPSTSS